MADDVTAPPGEDQERIDPFEIFSPQIRDNVRGLCYIGFLERPIQFCGHSFTLRTLRPGEKAAIALAVQPWRNTVYESIIWGNCHVALALTSIDGNDSFCPQAGPDITSFARARLNYITNPDNGWWQPTLDFLYTFYLSLESESLQAIQELQNLAERSPQYSPPSADSSTVPATSHIPTNLVTLAQELSS